MYNEANSIKAVLERVVSAPAEYFRNAQIEPELIVVTTGRAISRTQWWRISRACIRRLRYGMIQLPENRGKGAAIRAALEKAQSDFSIIQDADFEYDPVDYPKLLQPLVVGEAGVVLGSRFLVGRRCRPLGFWQAVVNRGDQHGGRVGDWVDLWDVETGFKAFRTSLAQNVPLG